MNKKAQPPKVGTPPGKFRLSLFPWGIVLLGIVIVGGVIFLLNQGLSKPGSSGTLQVVRAMGPEQAPVVITEYGDFGCTTCRGWERTNVRQQILDKYGQQVRFVWRDFPVITADSPRAAEAALCASDQGQFWPYHDLLYQKAPALGASDLKAYAAQIGMDTGKFNQCLDSGKYTASVDQDKQAAFKLGFTGTPSFVVNNTRLIGPASLEQFSAAIDAALQGKS